jgi:hypothetical protein
VITAAPLTVTAQSDSRGYNGTTSSGVAPVLTGTQYDASARPRRRATTTRHVGTTHVLSASGLVMNDGNSGNNYAITYVPSAATGVITAAPLTVTAQTDSRSYNGTTSSSVAPVPTGTQYDAVGTAATQTYDNKNVGSDARAQCHRPRDERWQLGQQLLDHVRPERGKRDHQRGIADDYRGDEHQDL